MKAALLRAFHTQHGHGSFYSSMSCILLKTDFGWRRKYRAGYFMFWESTVIDGRPS